MKGLVFFCLLLIQSSSWSQSDTARFVIRTAGFYNEYTEYDELEDSIAKKWDIEYLLVAGCMSTTEFSDSINHLNNLTSKRLKAHYGPDWKERFDQEVDDAYNRLLIQKENTFRETAACTTEQYSFKAVENLTQTRMKFTINPKEAVVQTNQDIRLMGLQHVDQTILYHGYDNLIALEFGSLLDTRQISIKGKGKLSLSDSCPASTTIQLRYRVPASVKYDTLLVETPNKTVLPFIFMVQYLEVPRLYFNEQLLDTTLNISALNANSVLSMHYDKSCLVPDRFTIHSWEISCSGSKRHAGGGSIIPVSVIRKLRKLKSGTKCSILITVSKPDCILRKKIVDFTLI